MSATSVGSRDAGAQRPPVLHAAVLWCLLALFCFRVVAQLVASLTSLPFLPPFDAWQSGVLPYPVLVSAQLAIVVLLTWIARGISSGRTLPRRNLGLWLLALGGIYFAFMAVRLLLGATSLSESSWWHAPIPTVFHLVLAGFLLVVGHFHAANQ